MSAPTAAEIIEEFANEVCADHGVDFMKTLQDIVDANREEEPVQVVQRVNSARITARSDAYVEVVALEGGGAEVTVFDTLTLTDETTPIHQFKIGAPVTPEPEDDDEEEA